ncbi:MAG: glycosyltransferase family 2 protein [Patescibacteria group bacterium]|nr:glycosyltransferase family 2 protein [Patescibacteria group bacterium]
MKDTVSVIIPTWNRAKTLPKAIKSALDQTYPPLEVLICDDGSTDSSEQIVKAIKNPKVKWIPGKHSGLPAVPRNRGLKQAKGEWIAFLDSDDYWFPDKLEKQLMFADIVKTKAMCTNAKSQLPNGKISGKILYHSETTVTFEKLLNNNCIITSTSLIHHSLLKIIAKFPENKQLKALEDYAFWLRVSTQTNFSYIKESSIIYNNNLKDSIRLKAEVDPYNSALQKKIVLENFLEWCLKYKISKYYIKKATRVNKLNALVLKKNSLFHFVFSLFKI